MIALLGSNKDFVDILSFYMTLLKLFMYIKVLLFSFTQDYYGVPFPGTTATLPGRDGLGNNPYSSKSDLLFDCLKIGAFFSFMKNIFVHINNNI